MPFITLDTGINMHYRDGGEGKTIVFIPGLSASVDTWNYQVLSLHDKFRCICIDLRGHGESDKPYSDYTYDEMCEDVASFLRQLDLRDVTLVGWSMGAGVALNYVTQFNDDGRVSKVCMVGPATPRFVATEDAPYGMDAETAAGALEGMRVALPEGMAAFAGINFHRTDLPATVDWFVTMWLKMPAYVGYKYFKTLVEADFCDRLPSVQLPVLICHGRHDQVCAPGWTEYMGERLPDSRTVWFENSGHALMVEEPDKLSDELAAFVGA